MPDDRLADIGGLFNATRSGLALNLQRPTSAVAEREVANAIRACESDRTAHSSAYRRLGWLLDDEGTWRYLHAKGALGPHDTREDLRAWMPPKSRCIGCIDPGRFDSSQIADYTRMSIDNLELLVDRTPWLALLGCVGIAPSGVVPNAAVGVVGAKAAGKTGLLCGTTAFLSPELAYERKVMTTADATAASIDLALSGHDYSFVLLDDFHPEFDPREQARQVKALDAALRRAHGAPSKGRAQLTNSVVEQASVNESHPVVLLSFEQLPAAAKSGLDRALTIEVTRSSTFKPGAFTDFAATGQSGALQVAYFGYLRYLAQRVSSARSSSPSGWSGAAPSAGRATPRQRCANGSCSSRRLATTSAAGSPSESRAPPREPTASSAACSWAWGCGSITPGPSARCQTTSSMV